MLTALAAVGQSTKAGLRRRRIHAEVHFVAADGSVGGLIDAVVSGTVEAGEPSRLGAGLLDVTVDSDPREPRFYCAIGEAINGPGGYFGWNLDALDDCLGGRSGAQAPFRLVWHDSAVAREHLVAGYDRRRLGPAITLEYLLDMLAAHHVEPDVR